MFIPLSFIFFPFQNESESPKPDGDSTSRPATLRSSRVRGAAPVRCRAASLRSSRPRQLRRPRRRVDRHGDLRQVLAAPLLCQSHSSGAATNRNNQTTRKKTPVFFGTNNSQRQFLSKHLGHFEGSSDQFLRCMLGKYEHRERVIGLQHGRTSKKSQRKFEFAATWSSRTSVEHRWSLSTPRKRLSLSVGLSEVAGFEGLETLITSRMKPTNHLEQAERYRTSVT